MKKFKLLILSIFFVLSYQVNSFSQNIPGSFADLAEKLMPSVVNISTTQTVITRSNPFPNFQFPPGSPFEDMFKEFGTPQERQSSALGSGFIIDEKGIVVTNNHVIEGAEDIVVQVNGNKEYKAEVIGADPLSDIAVLKIESKEKFTPVKFGDSDKARIGDWVIAIGNPFGFGGTVTSGIISARNRSIGLSRYEDYIQTDASINSGNSGGPLFDMSGDVIGINTAILGRSGNVGIGFSIPSNSAKIVIDQLIKFGETKRGWLGVRIQDVTKEIADVEKLDKPRGALVASVAPNSPSEKAGVKAGDIILEFNGEIIGEMKELPIIVARTEVGKKVKVKIWRNKKEIVKNITLGRLETSEEFKITEKEKPQKEIGIESLKISVRELTKEDIKLRNLPNQTTGLIITKIENESPLVNSIEINSIILEVQKKKIKNVNDLNQAVKKVLSSNQKTILLVIYNSQNQRRYIGVKLDWCMDLTSKIILIYGPTASGKSKFAVQLAKKIDGEIINADSMQVYKELKILSARPLKKDYQKIKHHLYGFQSVKKNFSTGDWLKLVNKKILDLKKRKKTPILVGGTGLYFKALTEGLVDIPIIPFKIRNKVRLMHYKIGSKKFFLKLVKLDPLVKNYINLADTQRSIRAYEIKSYTKKSMYEWFKNTKSKYEKDDFHKIYIDFPRTELLKRIGIRVEEMIKKGAIQEVKRFNKLRIGRNKTAHKAIGINEIREYLIKKIEIDEVIEKISIKTRQYAKRQSTWGRGNMSDWIKINPNSLNKFLKNI